MMTPPPVAAPPSVAGDEEDDPLASDDEDPLSTTSSSSADDGGDHQRHLAPPPIPNLNGRAASPTPRRKRRRAGTPRSEEAKRPAEDSRRLFQRLWTDEDEIVILEGFLDFTSRRRISSSSSRVGAGDTEPPFYDQIKARLRLDFNKSQLVEKLRRLKKKYRTALDRIPSHHPHPPASAFKTVHDHATFLLSRQIWGARAAADAAVDQIGGIVPDPSPAKLRRRRSRKRCVALEATGAPVGEAAKVAETPTIPAATSGVEETVRGCLSPMFVELLHCAVGGRVGSGGLDGLRLGLLPLGNGCDQGSLGSGAAADKWRKQQVLELEVFSKRIDLVQEQIQLMLRQLRSAG
uniref:Lipase n=1 Tax=Anthurium amnicola TaxID=1678845 RepID=A0A1D1Y8B1_9ARAE